MSNDEKKVTEATEETEVQETEVTEETEVQETETEVEETEADIDFEKELEALEGKEEKKGYSEAEKAAYNAKKALERATELGIDPDTLLPKKTKVEKKVDTPDVETQIERKLAERDARTKAKSEAEFKVIMHYVNRGLSVEDAHILANKGRLKRLGDEIERSNVRFGTQTTSGQKKPITKTPMLSDNDQKDLVRRGFKKNTDGSWEGKVIKLVPRGGSFVSMKRVAGKKDEWEPVRNIQE